MSKLFGFASDADGMCTDMERIENLIRLYCEHTDSECNGINPEEPYTAQVFLNRLAMGTSRGRGESGFQIACETD